MVTKDFSGIENNGLLPNPQDMQTPDDIMDLLDEYVESTQSQLHDLEQAVLAYEAGNNLEENAAAIRRILHKIKGEAGMVGTAEIGDICHQAEDAFEGIDQDKRPDMLLKVKDWIDAAVCHLAD